MITTQYFRIPLADGTYEFETGNHSDVNLPYHQMVLEMDQSPVSGKMRIEVRFGTDSDWVPVQDAQNINISKSTVVVFSALVRYYRFILSGVFGGIGPIIARIGDAKDWMGAMMPNGVFSGLRAMTVQNYTEANVKNGAQFEMSHKVLSVPSGGTVDILFQTGAKTVIVKSRQIVFTGGEIEARVYKNTTFTGGTVITPRNLTDVAPMVTTVSLKTAATILSVGTEWAAATHAFGTSSGTGNSVGTYSVSGLERVLAPNTSYMLRITNLDAGTVKMAVYLTWYEGVTDLPL